MKKKIFLSLLLAFSFTVSNIHAEETAIKDMDKSSSYARNAILNLAEKNIISGDAQGNFSPAKPISRVELVVLLTKVLNLDTTNLPTTATFKDVPVNHWAFKYVEAAYKAGIVTGISANEFGINNTTTREQMAVMIVRALGLLDQSEEIQLKNIDTLQDKGKISNWAQEGVDIALTAGIMNGVSKDSFAPQGNANKEQGAVVLDRFIKDESNIIVKVKDTYGIHQELKVILNGDIIPSNFYTVDENNHVLVSKEFIDNNVMGSPDVASHYTDKKELYIEASANYGQQGTNSLWFKVGVQNAYKNAGVGPFSGTATPFDQEEQFLDKKVQLTAAPVEKDGTIYVPLEDLMKILGASYEVNTTQNKITIQNDIIEKYPNLYSAFKHAAWETYVGDADSSSEITITNPATGDYSKTYSRVTATVNGSQNRAKLYVKLEMSGADAEEFTTEQIATADKVYELDTDNKWIEYSKAEWLELYGQDNLNTTVLPASLIMGYKNLPVKKAGTAVVNGEKMEKYTLELGSKGISYFLSTEEYNSIKALIGDVYNGTEKYQLEFYVDSHQYIRRQVLNFAAQASDGTEDNKLNIKIVTDSKYSNIGKAGAITAPDPSQIKQPE